MANGCVIRVLCLWLVVAANCATFVPPHIAGRHARGGQRASPTAVLASAVPPWVATPPSEEVWNDEIRAG